MNGNLATWKQTYYIFKLSGWEVRPSKLTVSQASEIIKSLKNGGFDFSSLNGAYQRNGRKKDKSKTRSSQSKWKGIFLYADKKGRERAKKCEPVPMVVQEHANQMDDNSPVVKSYFVPSGVCGFANVIISDGRSSFACWVRKNKEYLQKRYGTFIHKHYYGGLSISAGTKTQSLEINESYVRGFCDVLTENGVNCRMDSRLD